jgi:hypothetical protein
MAQVSIAWSLSKDYMSAPIIGTTKLENLWDIVGKSRRSRFGVLILINNPTGAVHIKLTDEEIKRLEEPYVPQAILGFA